MAVRQHNVGEVFNLAGGWAKPAGWRGVKGARITRVRPPPRCARPREVENLAYFPPRQYTFPSSAPMMIAPWPTAGLAMIGEPIS